MTVSREKRDQFVQWVETDKAFESHIIRTAEELSDNSGKIPFGPMLSWATGGGINIGHMEWSYGPEGSGKSLTNLSLIKNAQNYPEVMEEYLGRLIHFYETPPHKNKFKALQLKRQLKDLQARFPDGMSVLIFDTEDRFMATFAEQMGVSMRGDKLHVATEKIIENITKQMAAAMEAYHIVIVDSINNAESFSEASLEPGDYERGGAAKAWTRIRGVRRRLDRRENTVILVAQVRAPMGKMGFKGNEPRPEPPNIKAIKHNVSISIDYDAGRKLYMMNNGLLTDKYDKASNDFIALGATGKDIAGQEIRCKLAKNSTGKPYRNAAMRFKFPVTDVRTGELIQEVGFDEAYELALTAEHFHIVEGGGSGMFYLLDDKFERMGKPHQWKGEPALREAIEGDDELRERILLRLALDT